MSLASTVLSQVRVSRITGETNMPGRTGVLYSLPRTVLVVDIEYTRTDEIPGPYASLSQELLGMDQVIAERRTLFSLEDAGISSYVEPDPGQLFMVEMDEKASEAVWMEFSRNGLLAGAHWMEEEQLEAGPWMKDHGVPAIETRESFPFYKEASLKEVVDTITRVVTFDTLTYREKILKRLMVKQTDREKATEAAAMIHDIGQDQYTLLVGYQETAYEYEAIRYMYDQLEAQRRNYLQLFIGITRTEKRTARYFIVPEEGMLGTQHVIAGFSSESGMLPAGEGEDIVLAIETKGLASIIGSTFPPAAAAAATGFSYRVPETCRVSVEMRKEVLYQTSMVINQAGKVRSLPPSITRVEFDPVTGGIRKILYK